MGYISYASLLTPHTEGEPTGGTQPEARRYSKHSHAHRPGNLKSEERTGAPFGAAACICPHPVEQAAPHSAIVPEM